MTTVRALDDNDLAALLAFLAPSEARSLFLAGNATEQGITDRGGYLQGVWLGAFEGDALRGVLAWFRGPNSFTPVCEGYASLLVPAMVGQFDMRPRVVVGTRDRVDEVRVHLPPEWRIEKRQREVLFVLPWERYNRPDDRAASSLPLERAPEAAELIGMLHREWELPTDDAQNLRAAERGAREDRIRVREHEGRAVAMSCEPVASGRYVHVGATACFPEHRRRGLARACVAAVIERARDEGRASKGATLFTSEANHGAIALYESMGFVRDVPWEMCFLEA